MLAAETGSGKTLAYLAPLLSNMLQRRADDAATAASRCDLACVCGGGRLPACVLRASVPAGCTVWQLARCCCAGGDAQQSERMYGGCPVDLTLDMLRLCCALKRSCDPAGRDEPDRPLQDGILVLCPNAALCQQVALTPGSSACWRLAARLSGNASSSVWLHVPSRACDVLWQETPGALCHLWGGRPRADLRMQVVAFADALRGPGGAPLLRAAHVATTSPPPREAPDLVAVTPAGLITATQNYGPFFGWEWTRAGVVARCGSSAQACKVSSARLE